MIRKHYLAPGIRGEVELGDVIAENRSPFPRRTMQYATIPLRESDRYLLGTPVSVYNTGTGQVERAQVERWAFPYASGSERVIRITYPAVMAPGNLRQVHTVRATDEGVLPTFSVNPNVQSAWDNLQWWFFTGEDARGGHYVLVDHRGPSETIVNGHNVVVRRYRARIWHPSHAPSLETPWGVEIDFEFQRGMDVIQGWIRPFACDPRYDSESEYRGDMGDRRIGSWIYGMNERACQFVPFNALDTVRSLRWLAGENCYEWVWDDRTTHAVRGDDLNIRVPWGAQMQERFHLICQPQSLDSGGPRDQSCDSIRLFNRGTPGISDQWRAKQEAFGPWGFLPRRPKRHEHWEFPGRDAEYVRGRLEQEVMTFAEEWPRQVWAWHEMATKSDHSVGWPPYASTGGEANGMQQLQVAPAVLYDVPGLAHHLERGFRQTSRGMYFREVDGRPVRAEEHPQLYYGIGGPLHNTQGSSSPDKLGHTNGANFESSIHCLRSEDGESSQYQAPKHTHYELVGLDQTAVVFGDRGIAEVAYQFAQHKMASWSRVEFRRGAMGADRGAGRILSDISWDLWSMGHRDPYLRTFCRTHLVEWYFGPAHAIMDAQFPGRELSTLYIDQAQGCGGLVDNGQGNLPYWNPWMSALHIKGARGIARLLRDYDPDVSAFFDGHADRYQDDLARCGFPIQVNEVTAEIDWVISPAHTPYAAIWAAAFKNARRLTPQELQNNSYWRSQNICPLGPSTCGAKLGNSQGPAVSSPACTHAGDVHIDSWWSGGFAGGWFELSQSDVFFGKGSERPWRQRPLVHSSPGRLAFGRDNPSSTTIGHMKWLKSTLFTAGCVGAVHDWLTLRNEARRGNVAWFNVHGACASRFHPDHAWVVLDDDALLYRAARGNGAQQAQVTITGHVPAGGFWTDVCALNFNGQRLVALLDGFNDGSRTAFAVVLVAEADPSSVLFTVPFYFPVAGAAHARSIAWDPNVNEFVILRSDRTAWRLPPAPGIAAAHENLILDAANPLSIDIDESGKLLVVSAGQQNYVHVRGRGWGVPVEVYAPQSPPVSTAFFTEHVRTHDLQRIVSCGTIFSEMEV